MQTFEILLYISITILLGGMITIFLANADYEEMYTGMKKIMFLDKHQGFEKVDKSTAFMKIQSFLKECRRTDQNVTYSFYIDDKGTFTKAQLFDYYKNVSWCESIQSAENSCGVGEDIVMSDIELPKVILLKCVDNTHLEIS